MSSVTTIYILRIITTLVFTLIYTYSYSYQNKIIAYVNNDIVTSSEIEKRVRLIESQNNLKIDDNQRFQVIYELIDQRLLAQVANNNSLVITKNQISHYLKNTMLSRQLHILDKLFKSNNLDRAEFIKYCETQLLIKKLIEYKIQPEILVSSQEIIYNKRGIIQIIQHLPAINTGSIAEIYKIFINKEKNIQKDIKKIIYIIYALVNNGFLFPDLIKQFLQGKISTYDGLVGWIKISTLSLNIMNALSHRFATGTISNPININNNIVILYINNIKNLDYVKRHIDDVEFKKLLYYQKMNNIFNHYIKTLRKNSYIKIVDTY